MSQLLDEAIAKLKQLPLSEQERIAQILLKEVEKPELKGVYSPLDLENHSFVGMWKDRTEMQNSSEWVRQLRSKQWQILDKNQKNLP